MHLGGVTARFARVSVGISVIEARLAVRQRYCLTVMPCAAIKALASPTVNSPK